MTTLAPSIRNAVTFTVAVLAFGASLVFGFAGTAHAHGTWTPPPVPRSPMVHTHHGPFSVLHQAPSPGVAQGPFSVLQQMP
ncbi:hypothetical protein GCM10009641_02400 [Mycobacterium cookii]|uniref:Uncharacterized protein n=1 Tax=Mycobacterium cookii TaxID=1775 RepID=A0A7I7L3P7_9MYCO|nr:hypothetical protein [Mycobacterium cookii]MCV7329453.1 hypothetical protein [Mycobacterium cookii]BBX48714.1 hypothetical protein MCOO_47290 [Mycobacterium cookii]